MHLDAKNPCHCYMFGNYALPVVTACKGLGVLRTVAAQVVMLPILCRKPDVFLALQYELKVLTIRLLLSMCFLPLSNLRLLHK